MRGRCEKAADLSLPLPSINGIDRNLPNQFAVNFGDEHQVIALHQIPVKPAVMLLNLNQSIILKPPAGLRIIAPSQRVIQMFTL